MDISGSAVASAMVGGLRAELESLMAGTTDHIIITNASYAGMDESEHTPRYLFNKERCQALDDHHAPLLMAKAMVRSKLLASPNALGWLQQDHAVTVGNLVCRAGAADCDLCAAAVVSILHKTKPGLQVEVFGTGGHAFVVVNRAGDPADMNKWGAACFVIDIWGFNQGILESRVLSAAEYLAHFPGGFNPRQLM